MDLQKQRAAHLLETEELAQKIANGDPALRIVDMRGYVHTKTEPDGFQTADYVSAQADYRAGHLPGAVYLDWTQDIVDENDPVSAQIAPPEKFQRVMEAAGIGNDSLVVAYDSHPASQFATRLWWALRYYGFDNVRVLNGGWKKWTAEKRAVETTTSPVPSAVFTPSLRPQWRVTADEVNELRTLPDTLLIDVRDEGQYSGKIRRGERGGHIPDAMHLAREAFFTPEGTFRAPEELQAIAEQNAVRKEKRTVAYCNGGVAATSVLFTLSMLGHSQLANYDGSWNEWNLRPALPVENPQAE